ncbi:hypothetical protein THOG11_20290 [Vibrio harveyi]|uniref:Uncharacterized protein n=1 Tax=Vibrio harveyi TaxID=669 RepID=A0A454D5S0_VIBHA|nr:hypothetical protein VCHENC01_3706 [Vibrio harveyi]EKM34008.1 hypothetical protein VCHENC02_0606 [Vibrio harveyi]CAH1234392.1 hypothetical protein TH15OA1_530111 [Vibrio harveyi]CAH1541427.1 hypothetical protein VHARVF571_510054 [Vibrio harveyi]CAH1556495.1 hypothetical protein THOD03_20287 [Vibrio harveyi]
MLILTKVFNNVDLPQPFGPINAVIFPFGIETDKFGMIVFLP